MDTAVIEGYRLSPQQKSLWREQQGSDFTPHAQCAVRIEGDLDTDRLRGALSQVIARHEMLRTTFERLPAMELPLQVVNAEAPELSFCEIDLSTEEQAAQEAQIAACVEEQGWIGFDLEQGPVVRFCLLRLAARDHLLILTLPALCADSVSLTNLLTECGRLYANGVSAAEGEEEEAVQYVTFSEWQHELLADEEGVAGREFWQEQERAAIEALRGWRLPFESNVRQQARARADADTENDTTGGTEERGWKTAKVTRELSAPEAERLLGRRAGESGAESSVGEVLLAGWEVLLWRLTGQAEVVVGVRCDGRKHEELREVVGPLADYLPVRCRVEPDYRFSEVLSLIGQSARTAYARHEYYGSREGGERQPDETYGWPVGFDFEQWPAPVQVDGLRLSLTRLSTCAYRFKLRLSATLHPQGGVRLEWHYDPQLFTAAGVEFVAAQYMALLRNVLRNASERVSDIELIGEEESARLEQWNDTRRDYERHGTIHELFEHQAAATPDAVAVSSQIGELSYQQLNEQANQLAHYLQAQGVSAETRVGVLLERSPELIVTLLAILKAGGAYVPLDPAYPQERLRFMLEDAGVAVLITQEQLGAGIASGNEVRINLDDAQAAINKESRENPRSGVSAQNLAYLIYTSGSTGRPKGVMIQHGSVSNLLTALDHAVYQSLTHETDEEHPLRVSLNAPVSFDASVKQWTRLTRGATLCLVPEEARADAEALLRFINESRLDVLDCTPSQLRMLLAEGLPEAAPYLRAVLVGGEALDAGLWAQLRRGTGGYSADQRVSYYNVYGPTECTVDATACSVSEAGPEPTIGRPIANAQVYVLDAGHSAVPVGVAGELYIGGAGVGRGYLNRPELTAERFIPNPYSAVPGARMYRTGDLARFLPNGEIEFIGRVDHQVKIRGFRIELGEIEAALTEHAAVKECIVIVREDVEGDKRLVAYLSAHEGESVTGNELRASLKERMPDYMIPSAFVVLERLPLTTNGKVDRQALPAPELISGAVEAGYMAPRTPVEELLAGLWSEVLRVERVSIEDNFFELGGHSLLATQLVSRIREAFGVELPLRALFEQPSVCGLAARVEQLLSAEQGMLAPPLTPVSRDQALPLSFAQQRLWFLNQLEPESSFYNVPAGVRLSGTLDVEALERALSEIVRRHEVLRTTFQSVDGEPVQVIGAAVEVRLPVIDLQGLGESEREAEAERLAQEEAMRPFDLSTGPLLRTTLLRLAAEEHVLLVTLHHIVSDGWSTAILVRELSALYTAFIAGEASPLTELPVQYADYSVWQRNWFSGEVLDEQLGYWRQQLTGAPEVLELPTDRARPAVQSFRGASTSFKLTPEVSAGLQRLSREQGVTLFMTLLAAFQTLLARYSGQQEIVVGTPIAGRTQSESEALIGFFINTLALRTRVEAEMSFVELLRQVREVTLGAYAHQEVPFDKLVEELAPRRDNRYSPLFQVMLVLQNAPDEQLQLGELELQVETGELRTSRFDLTLSVTERNGALEGIVEYSTALFDGWRMERLVEHFAQLAESVVRDAQQTLGEIVLLGEAERQRQVVEWNETASEYERHSTIHEMFERQAEATPQAIAISSDTRQLSYQELNEQANQLAHYLRAQGVCAETRVGILLERSPELIVTLLAILKAGGAYVPLDPSYPQERLRFMLEDAGVAVLVTQESVRQLVPAESRVTVVALEDAALGQQSRDNLTHEVSALNLAYVIYTSGSTGTPKGIGIVHQAVLRLLRSTNYISLTPRDVVAQASTASFDASTFEVWGALLHGARLHLVSREVMLSPAEFATELRARAVSVLFLTTALFNQMVREEPTCFSTLRQVMFGGEACEVRRVREVLRAGGPERLLHVYGPTESTTFATWQEVREVESAARTVPIGVPLANTQVYVLDGRMQVVPVGVAGELYISGDGLARGYLNEPAQTAARFIPNPFSDAFGARMYRTGDVVRYLANGEIEFIGRVDHQVKVRGFRIELGEIEAALTELKAVKECIVIVREDVEGDKRLVAYLSAHEGESVTGNELRASLKERMPDYMIPSAFVVLERLPLTTNGKVDRQALPAPEQISGAVEAGYMAPRTPVEELLAGLWSEVLRVERVSIEDNFFELGGHSLLATQLVSRIREAFGVELPLRALFECPTVSALAQSVEVALNTEQDVLAPPLERANRDQALPLSFAQQRLWFLNQLEPESSFYNVPAGVCLSGALDVPALERALSEIVRRHEVLRTTFQSRDDEPVQVIGKACEVHLPVIDLQGLGESEREAEAQRLAQEEAMRPFDLSTGPLLRTTLLRLSATEHVLLVTLHHIVSDGWSTAILVRELSALYTAYSTGAESPLSELPIQYADYSVWQRNWLQGEVLDEQLGYWRQQLAGAPEVLELPTERVRPAVQSFRGETAAFKLTPELSSSVQRLSREQGVTLFMTLLAAFKVLLYRSTGQEDIVLGAPIAGRTQSQSEALIGFFINNLVLRTSLSGDPTFVELLKRVREVTLGAYAHQEVPFDKLVEELAPRRDTGFAPLFQATFGVQNAPVEELELGELKLSYLGHGGEAVRYDLTLWVWESAEGGTSVQWRYNTDLFTYEEVAGLQGQYEALLSHIVAQPETSLDNLEMLTRAEKEQQQQLKLAREKSSQRKLAALKSKPVKPAKVIA